MDPYNISSFLKSIEENEIKNKKTINERGFNNQYDFSVYEFLKHTIPGMDGLEISHSKKDSILTLKFYNSDFEYIFFTGHEIYEYPEIIGITSIPKVENYKKEIITYYRLNKLNNELSKLSYYFNKKEIKETVIDLSLLEKEINSERESQKKSINLERYKSDLRRSPEKYREIDSFFEKEATELSRSFINNFLLNRKTQDISEIFDHKFLEKEIIKNLPKGINYFKYRNFIGSNFFERPTSGHIFLDRRRIDKSIIYFYLFWNKNYFFIKSYISSIYSKNFKLENILIIDSLFTELNKDRIKTIDTFLQGNINSHIDHFSRKDYKKLNSFKEECEILENVLNIENNFIEEGEEEIMKEEKRIEDFKFIQNIFNK